jgi:hypothetical protein
MALSNYDESYLITDYSDNEKMYYEGMSSGLLAAELSLSVVSSSTPIAVQHSATARSAASIMFMHMPACSFS